MTIVTTYDPSKPSTTWKKVLMEFLIEEFPASEVHVTFSPLDLTATWPKDKIIQIIPLEPINKRRYKEIKDEEAKIVHKETMECNIAVLCKTGPASDDISDRLQEKINGETYKLGGAGLKDAQAHSPVFDPFVIGKLAVFRHIHRVSFQIETYS